MVLVFEHTFLLAARPSSFLAADAFDFLSLPAFLAQDPLLDAFTKLAACEEAIAVSRTRLLAFHLYAGRGMLYVDARRGLVQLLAAFSGTQNELLLDVVFLDTKLYHQQRKLLFLGLAYVCTCHDRYSGRGRPSPFDVDFAAKFRL